MTRPCSICALPHAVREDVKRQRREGVTLRGIAASLAAEGHLTNKDALHRHLSACVAPLDLVPPDADDRASLVAVIVRAALHDRYHRLADQIALELHDQGLATEARIVQSAACEMMRSPLPALPAGSPAAELLLAQVLAQAVGNVLRQPSDHYRRLGTEIAAECRRLGSEPLAQDFDFLAARARARGISPISPISLSPTTQ